MPMSESCNETKKSVFYWFKLEGEIEINSALDKLCILTMQQCVDGMVHY